MATEKVHPHRGAKVHPAHMVKGVDKHHKMNHYPTSQKHSGYSTREPFGAGMGAEAPGCDGIAGCMDGGGATPYDGGGMTDGAGGGESPEGM